MGHDLHSQRKHERQNLWGNKQKNARGTFKQQTKTDRQEEKEKEQTTH